MQCAFNCSLPVFDPQPADCCACILALLFFCSWQTDHTFLCVLRLMVILMAAMFLYQMLSTSLSFNHGNENGSLCLLPSRVITTLQFWRIYSAQMFHFNLLHLFFNLVSFVPLATAVEKHIGTVAFACILLLLPTLAGICYIFLSLFISLLFYTEKCMMGYSGVIFGLIVVDTVLSQRSHVKPFGMFTMPAAWYPWALMVFIQLLVPQSSFLGHFSGLAMGELYMRLLHPCCQHQLELFVSKLESGPAMRFLSQLPRYKARPEGGLPMVQQTQIQDVWVQVQHGTTAVVNRLKVGFRSNFRTDQDEAKLRIAPCLLHPQLLLYMPACPGFALPMRPAACNRRSRMAIDA